MGFDLDFRRKACDSEDSYREIGPQRLNGCKIRNFCELLHIEEI